MKKQFNITPEESAHFIMKETVKFPKCEIKDYIILKKKLLTPSF